MKKCTIYNLLVVLMVKLEALEKILVVDVEETSSSDHKEKVRASAFVSTVDLVHSLSRYAQATHETLTSLRALLVFRSI